MGVKYILIYIVSHILTLTVAYLYIDCRIYLHWLTHIFTLTVTYSYIGYSLLIAKYNQNNDFGYSPNNKRFFVATII